MTGSDHNKTGNIFLELLFSYTEDRSFAEKCRNEIIEAYSDENRFYHNLNHLKSMLEDLEEFPGEIENVDALKFSVFYHDIVYNIRRSDNEIQSSLILEEHLKKTRFTDIQICKDQIVASKKHAPSRDPDTKIFLDLDLAILGKSAEVYENYTKAIRKEFHIYPDVVFYPARKKVLQDFLERPRIYQTEYFFGKHENQARINLQNELGSL